MQHVNVDELDWSDDESDLPKNLESAAEEGDALIASPRKITYPSAYEEITVTEPDRLVDHKRSNFFSGNVKLKSIPPQQSSGDSKSLRDFQSTFKSKWNTRQNTVNSGLTFDSIPVRSSFRQNTAISGLSYQSTNHLSRQSTFASDDGRTTAISTTLPPAILKFFGEDIITEMWQILLSTGAVDSVSQLVKINSIRDLAKWIRQINSEQIKFDVDEKSLWKELGKWDPDDWVNFSELLQILQRHSKSESTTATLLAPTANKDVSAAKMSYGGRLVDGNIAKTNPSKPIMLNRCCAHAACQVVCSYAYTNTREGNLGHDGSTSIATADGVFNLDFLAPLFDKRRNRPKSGVPQSGHVDMKFVLDPIEERAHRFLSTDDASSQMITEAESSQDMQPDNDGSEDEDDGFSRRDLFRLNVAFSRVLVKRPGGRLRVGDLLEVMKEAGIVYDLSKVAIESWNVAKHLLVESLDSVLPLMKRLQKDEDLITGPLAHLIKYPVPLWLQQEFSQAEILLYQHHFMLIDIDGGGSIDSDELQLLLNSFCGEGAPGGYQVSKAEAAEIVSMFDLDGGGTLDFVEFLVLIYRLQRGTMSKEFLDSPAGALLVKALTEAKRQLHLFEEIEEVGLNPPKGCSILSFGGSPVLCVVAIQVQPESIAMEGSAPQSISVPFFVTVNVTMFDGYPYRAPDVQLKEPGVVHPLFIRALDGSCRMLHLARLWQGLDRLTEEERADLQIDFKDDLFAHNLESLLRHMYNMVNVPSKLWSPTRCIEWLPQEMCEIYRSWQWKWEQLRGSELPLEKKMFTLDDLSDKATMHKFQKLPRLQQMHMGTLLLYLQDPGQYRSLARSFTQFKRVLDK